MRLRLLHTLGKEQRGFTLIESIVAIAIVGLVVTSVLVAMGNGTRIAGRQQESVRLTQLIRTQIELIQQSPFLTDPTAYPAITGVPEGFSVSFTSTDPGTTYTYPAPVSETLTSTVQQFEVTATGDYSESSMTFYKTRMP